MGSRVWIDGCGRLEVFEAPDDVFVKADAARAQVLADPTGDPWMDLRTIHGGIATLRADMIAVVEEYDHRGGAMAGPR